MWRERKWRLLLNLINHLPPNSHFNEALTGDRETMMALHIAQENRRAKGLAGDEKPVGPRVSQVSEEARRLGEVVAMVRWLGKVIIAASPKFQGGKIGKVEPYTRPVMIDGATGEWVGTPTTELLKRRHEKRLKIAQEAAERHKAIQQDKE